MANTQLLSLTAIITFGFMPFTYSASTSRNDSPNLANVNPTQALIYYGQRELQKMHRTIMSNYSTYQKQLAEAGDSLHQVADKLNPKAREFYKHFESVPSQGSTSEQYWDDFLSYALPALIKTASEITKVPAEELLNNNHYFRTVVQGLLASPDRIKIICIVRTIQRESRQHINIKSAITTQAAALKTFETAIQNQETTLTLIDENKELEHIWKNFKMPSQVKLNQILEKKRDEMRPSSCSIL